MGRIRILSDRVANQIAAGEVVERPASIVKELVENSLDAGATRIEIEFRNGGRSFIRVEDNGGGMSRDDALLSLERHATSKIREAGDLDRVLSFGFRGEALPSIASVSRFTMQTRDADSENGSEIVINGGKIAHVRDCGMPAGTRIVVANLFNSVPARRKFLKSDATEAAHIIQHARLYALANPGVSFALVEDGRTILQSPVCTTLAERVAEVFGKQLAQGLAPVEAEENTLALRGLISRPGIARATRHEMVTFVNRRPVDSRTLAYAILESYHASLPKGRYPVAFLFLELPPAAVDVNVHPAKREVRFRDEVQVRGFTIRAVLGTLRALRGETLPAAVPATPAPGSSPAVVPASSFSIRPREAAPAAGPGKPAPAPAPVYSQSGDSRPRPPPPPLPPPSAPPAASRADVGWRRLGDLAGGYSLFETPGGLVVLDRVAASERVWFERIRRQQGEGAMESQRLLLPLPLELDPVASAALAEGNELLARCGLVIEPFGRDFFRIEAIPPWLEPGDAESLARDLVSLLASGRIDRRDGAQARDAFAKSAACRAAAPAGRTLAPEVLESLVADLLRCENPHSAPGGRPVLIEISAGELARRFHKQPLPRVVAEE
ncbi:MAG: DNA mismatch repair endonuclease MutL [Opitutaceae bacterium]